MARITGKVTPKDKDGNAVDILARPDGNANAFRPIEPGYYNAFVTKLNFGTLQMNVKGFPNPDTKDGKWTHGKLTPELTLINDYNTQIRNQDTILGVLVDNAPFQPRGNDENPVWKEAMYLLSALGLFTTDGEGVFQLDFDPDLVKDRVIRVQVDLGGYVKGGEHKGNYKPYQLREMLTVVNGGIPYEPHQIPLLVKLWNLENGLTNEQDEEIEEGVSLRLKNYVVHYYSVSPQDAEKNGWFYDHFTKAVFTSQSAYQAYASATPSVATKEETW